MAQDTLPAEPVDNAGAVPAHRKRLGEHDSLPGAIVTGADFRALGVVRSLGRRGIPVWVIKDDDHQLAAHSRYNARTISPPRGNGLERLHFLLQLSKQHGLQDWVLLPTDDEAVAFVSRFHGELSKFFQLVTPPWEFLQWAVNKLLLYRLAGFLGVPQPWTWSPESVGELSTEDIPFPVIVKPAQRDVRNSFVAVKAWRADDRAALVRAYQEAAAMMPPALLMVQEVIPGGGENQFSYTALCRDGVPLVSLTANRKRQYPSDFGRTSTFVETVDEPCLVEPSLRLLKALKLNCFVEIEYKRDPRNGQFKLLDINPRVWGWQSLCGRAGVDYPCLLWLMLNGEPLPAVRPRWGVRWVRLASDVPNAMRDLLHGRASALAYVQSFLGAPLEEAVIAGDDPWPGVLELPLLANTVVRRFFRRAVGFKASACKAPLRA